MSIYIENKREELLTRKEVSKILRVSEGTLATWACTKRYPLDFIKVGRLVRYRYTNVTRFIDIQTREGRTY